MRLFRNILVTLQRFTLRTCSRSAIQVHLMGSRLIAALACTYYFLYLIHYERQQCYEHGSG